MWKSDIGEHKIYPAIVLFKNPQRPNSMGGWQHDVPGFFEHLSYGPLKAFLVFYEKNRCYIFGGLGRESCLAGSFQRVYRRAADRS